MYFANEWHWTNKFCQANFLLSDELLNTLSQTSQISSIIKKIVSQIRITNRNPLVRKPILGMETSVKVNFWSSFILQNHCKTITKMIQVQSFDWIGDWFSSVWRPDFFKQSDFTQGENLGIFSTYIKSICVLSIIWYTWVV